ncbi:MAG: ABC transporter permease [Candidatus Thermoplasmatota archaeon]|nr:ABC transporter permease [Candidatus Thermoplasmatota archaeon]
MKHSLTPLEKWSFIKAYVGRKSRLWVRFKVSFAFSFVAMFVSIAIFYFINVFVGDIPGYGNYFSFVLIGLAVNHYMQATLTTYLSTVRNAYFSNWLEIILTSPMRLKTFFYGVMTWTYLYSTLHVSLYFIVGMVVFGAVFTVPLAAWVIVPILALLIISLSGIGLISAAMFLLVNAKGEVEPIGWTIATLSGLVAGVYFPPEYLPAPLLAFSRLLPQTYAVEAIRDVLLRGYDITHPSIQMAIVYLLIFCVVLLPLGLWLFNVGIRKAERDGTLARWA